ncbi:MAG TPA: hypothetical protein VH062_06310 [Polyangiaceae bacterium]|jgi:hypothetical protein|nr:hypothetical protein [Polyangiaceae bacterium]
MTPGEDDVEARLVRLAGATAALHPSGGFTARVMSAIEREQPLGLIDALWSSSRRFLPIAAFAAAVAVVWAVENQTTVDDALAVTYGAMDLDAE